MSSHPLSRKVSNELSWAGDINISRNLVESKAVKNTENHGIANINVKLGNPEFSWEMYVVTIGDSVLSR